MSREGVLLKEYEICQQDSSNMISAHWTVVGIFIGINTGLLGAVAYILNSYSLGSNIRWIVGALGLASILIIACLYLWLRRVNFLVDINNRRMYQIERELGMAKTRLLDKCNKKACRELRRLGKPRPCIPCNGIYPIMGIYAVFIMLWIAAIVGAFMLDC